MLHEICSAFTPHMPRKFHESITALYPDMQDKAVNTVFVRYFTLYLAVLSIIYLAVFQIILPQFSISLVIRLLISSGLIASYLLIRQYPDKLWLGLIALEISLASIAVNAYMNAGSMPYGLMFAPVLVLMIGFLSTRRDRVTGLISLFALIAFAGCTTSGLIGFAPAYPETFAQPLLLLLFLFLSTLLAVLFKYLMQGMRDLTYSRLRENTEMLATANNARRDFLTTVSHELRTPMNIIAGSLEVLKHSPDEDKRQEILQMMEDASRNLTSQIEDLLDFSRMESGELTLNPAPTRIQPLLERIVKMWRPAAEKKNLQILYTSNLHPDVQVMADGTRLQQITSNLISNAVKFSDTAGLIRVELNRVTDQDGDSAFRIAVHDEGPGIPEKNRSFILDPFIKGEKTGNAPSGNGLGLTIAHRLTVAMSGALSMDCPPQGGTIATIQLKLPIVDMQAIPAPCDLDAPAVKRLLCVDDHPTNLRILTTLLSSLGFQVTCASSGEEALLMASTDSTFDAILMDIMMPGINGVEATQHIRDTTGPNQHTPIIALTANVMPDQIASYKAAGMNGVVAKPIDTHRLVNALENAFHSQDGGDKNWHAA